MTQMTWVVGVGVGVVLHGAQGRVLVSLLQKLVALTHAAGLSIASDAIPWREREKEELICSLVDLVLGLGLISLVWCVVGHNYM